MGGPVRIAERDQTEAPLYTSVDADHDLARKRRRDSIRWHRRIAKVNRLVYAGMWVAIALCAASLALALLLLGLP
jgi:hypothetical protein